MTWPASLPLVPVRVTLDQLLSTPGDVPDARVTFILPGPLAGPDSLVLPIPRAVRAAIDGTSTVNLPPNDASGWTPTGWAYTVLIEAGPAMVTGTLTLAAADVDAGVDLSARLVLDAVPQPGVTYIPASQKGQPLGVATLGANGLVPSSQLPASSGGSGGAVDSVAGRTGDVILVATDISDSSSVGRSVVTAANAAAARTAIGAGTGSSNLALGTTSTTAYRGDLGAAAASDATAAAAAAAAAQSDVDALSASLGGAALLDVGTTAGDVAAGNAPAAAVTAHVALGDPHTQYLLESTATTKGDLLAATGSATIVRLPVGTDGQVLTADSAAAAGVAWDTPSGGGGGSTPAAIHGYVTAGDLIDRADTSGSWAIEDASLQFTLSGVTAGDEIYAEIGALLDQGNSLTDFYELVVIKSAAIARFGSTGSSTPAAAGEGDPAIYPVAGGRFRGSTPFLAFTAAAGDISSGSITFGLARKGPGGSTAGGGARIFASADRPYRWYARNDHQ